MKVALNIKVEDALKEDFEKICDKLGISLSGAVIMFMNQVVIQERIPFELTTKKIENTKGGYPKNDIMVESYDKRDMQMEVLLRYMELLTRKNNE